MHQTAIFLGITAEDVRNFITSLAVAISVYVYFQNKWEKRRSVTIDVWKTWSSKDYSHYRVISKRALLVAKKNKKASTNLLMRDVRSNDEIDEAVGSIEHLFYELSEIKKLGLLDEKLFLGLFKRNALLWKDILSDFDRTGANAHTWEELSDAFKRLLGDSYYEKSRYHRDYFGNDSYSIPKNNKQNWIFLRRWRK